MEFGIFGDKVGDSVTFDLEFVNLKVMMQQKVEMLESLRKMEILMQQIVMMLREMIQNSVLMMKQKMKISREIKYQISLVEQKEFFCLGI